jgi:hypothetical protein
MTLVGIEDLRRCLARAFEQLDLGSTATTGSPRWRR